MKASNVTRSDYATDTGSNSSAVDDKKPPFPTGVWSSSIDLTLSTLMLVLKTHPSGLTSQYPCCHNAETYQIIHIILGVVSMLSLCPFGRIFIAAGRYLPVLCGPLVACMERFFVFQALLIVRHRNRPYSSSARTCCFVRQMTV